MKRITPTLEEAVRLATKLHKGQKDKINKPYISHPLQVMLSLNTEKEKITGVLHDVVEDCGITLKDLRRMGYCKEVLVALDLLTKRPVEEKNYYAFIARIIKSGNELAMKVKIADIMNNLDPLRFPVHPTTSDYRRRNKYKEALETISSIDKKYVVFIEEIKKKQFTSLVKIVKRKFIDLINEICKAENAQFSLESINSYIDLMMEARKMDKADILRIIDEDNFWPRPVI